MVEILAEKIWRKFKNTLDTYYRWWYSIIRCSDAAKQFNHDKKS